NATKSKSYEGARIKETGLRRGIFFHGDFPLLAAVEIVADNSKTPARADAFFSHHSKSAAETCGLTMFLPSFSRRIRGCYRCEVARIIVQNSITNRLAADGHRHFQRWQRTLRLHRSRKRSRHHRHAKGQRT